MTETRTHFICKECGHIAEFALEHCPQCGAEASFFQKVLDEAPIRHGAKHNGVKVRARPLIHIEAGARDRLPVSINEFSRVLGGGVVPGSVILVGGDPGIGKSTLLLQIAIGMCLNGPVLYVSGEESHMQVKIRAERLSSPERAGPQEIEDANGGLPEHLYLLTETDLEDIIAHVHALSPRILVIDSIQTVYDPAIDSSAGSVTQLRECTDRFRHLAKSSGLAIFLIGHVTKEGYIAGPRLLEHMVDTVLYLEGNRYQSYRLLRAVKNRFGATSEVGVFEMLERGMVEVPNPSETFLAERVLDSPGSAIAVTMEGSRPLLVEIQGLTSPSSFGNPRRSANGIDAGRLRLITAVLTRRLNYKLSEQDVFVNVVGGLRVGEPAADLAVAAAIASSTTNKALRPDAALIGEIGLSGELRAVGHLSARVREAAAFGFKRVIMPRRLRKGARFPRGIKVEEARTLRDALEIGLASRS